MTLSYISVHIVDTSLETHDNFAIFPISRQLRPRLRRSLPLPPPQALDVATTGALQPQRGMEASSLHLRELFGYCRVQENIRSRFIVCYDYKKWDLYVYTVYIYVLLYTIYICIYVCFIYNTIYTGWNILE